MVYFVIQQFFLLNKTAGYVMWRCGFPPETLKSGKASLLFVLRDTRMIEAERGYHD